MMNKVSDQSIIQKAAQQLSSRGMQSPCHIAVIAHSGDVTLSGTILYEHQRLTALHAVRGINGVRRVVDHMQIMSKTHPRDADRR
jgi:osmotically-inducible protein OsmY